MAEGGMEPEPKPKETQIKVEKLEPKPWNHYFENWNQKPELKPKNQNPV